MLLQSLREQVVQTGLEALSRRIVHGTAGNFSIRDDATGLIAISPSGMPYPTITPADVVIVDEHARIVDGTRRPSSETPMHTMIMRAFPTIRCIVHTHSHYSTVVGTIRDYLPPILTEVCCVVGEKVPVTRYGLTGLPDIGESVIEVMGPDTKAVLMRNHGPFTIGRDARDAVKAAVMLEDVARTVHIARQLGDPLPIEPAAIDALFDRYQNVYGQPTSAGAAR